MKLAISALLLSMSVAAPLVAQSASDTPPPPPGMHDGGPRGPHGPGMFGPRMEARRVETIANSPFTAQFTDNSNFTTPDGKQEQRSSTSTIYRDSQGRVREERTLPPPPPRPSTSTDAATAPVPPSTPRTMIVILDPVAHTITRLNADRKTATVQTVPADFFTRAQQRTELRENGSGPAGNDRVTWTDLGNKVIAGVTAKGERTTVTLPSRDGGATHTMTHETWFSPDAKFQVSSSETGDRGSHTDTLTSFNKAEPNAALFQVPAGYTTEAAPERHFGGRHHGPGAPGAPNGSDAPPQPPPAM